MAKNPRKIIKDDEEETFGSSVDNDNSVVVEEPIANTPQSSKEPPPATKKKQNSRKDWDELVGRREPSPRTRRPTEKVRTGAVGMDEDHPTDQQARNSTHAERWAEARKKEKEQLERYGVFTRVKREDIPEGTHIVDTKWVYVIKRRRDGTIGKYKARKVGRGFIQIDGINCDSEQTFSVMMRPETFKTLLIIA